MYTAPEVSKRSVVAQRPVLSYLDKVFEALSDQFDPLQNPDGYVSLCVAENVLSFEGLLRPKVVNAMSTIAGSLAGEEPASQSSKIVPFYGDMKGHQVVRKSVCKYLDWALLENQHGYEFDWNNLIVCNGCSSALDAIAWTLFDAGDACLIPTPYYPAFDNDLTVRANVKIFHVEQHQGDGTFKLTESALEHAFQLAVSHGHTPKAILLTNPQNPLATTYSVEELRMALRWARTKQIHVVSDEIYARSVHSPFEGCPPFTSMACIALEEEGAAGKIGPDVHLIYGMSKDFTLSGYRVGFLYSEHPQFQLTMNNLSVFASVSSLTQQILFEIFSDLEWVRYYLSRNNSLLANQCERATLWCQRVGVPFVKPCSGLFMLVNLAEFLPAPGDWDSEKALFDAIADECKVLLTPGQSAHAPSPGFFRLCYAGVAPQALEQALVRLETFLYNARQRGGFKRS